MVNKTLLENATLSQLIREIRKRQWVYIGSDKWVYNKGKPHKIDTISPVSGDVSTAISAWHNPNEFRRITQKEKDEIKKNKVEKRKPGSTTC